jgi:transcriptional regulator with XRE-family HTH domain
MARPTRIRKSPMAQAISRFRQTLGDTQQQFAARTGLSVTSIARYETNSPPSKKVLARFVEIARAANLPTFVEIFENRLEPEEEINLQDFAAVKQLLKRLAENLRPEQLRQGRLALACLISRPESVRKNRLPEALLTEVDKALDKTAAELVRGRDPEVERKRIHFLRTRDVASWADFIRAFEKFRSARLAEARDHGNREAQIFDMFTIPAEDQFEFTEQGIVLHDQEPSVAPEEPLESDSSFRDETEEDPEHMDGGGE